MWLYRKGCNVIQTVYIAIRIGIEDVKNILGIYVVQNESAKFWLSILNGLKSLRLKDILLHAQTV
ncbi:transposase [Lachnoclostridium pacaense]|nr:transposase [Lachnoclostridium pacaense]